MADSVTVGKPGPGYTIVPLAGMTFTEKDPEPDLRPGTICAVHFGDYRHQEVWVVSGANIGNLYPLGGEFGRRPQVAEDPRTAAEKMFSRDRWQQPPGTIPLHPVWRDVVRRGPVTVLYAGANDIYTHGWRDGRRHLLGEIEQLADDGDYDAPVFNPLATGKEG